MPFHASKRANNLIHRMHRQDFLVLIAELVVLGLLLAHFFPVLIAHHWINYVIIILAAEVYFYLRLVKHKK